MRLGINARDFGRLTLEEMARKVSENGFDCIQLALPDTISDIDAGLGKWNPGMANHIGETFYKYGVQIAVLECFINPVLPDESERRRQLDMLKEHIRYARDFGCSMISTETGSLNANFSFNVENHSEKTFQVLLRSLNEVIEEAEKFGVLVCVEGCSALVANTPEKIRRMLDEVGSNNLQVLLDPVDLLSVNNYRNQDSIIKEAFDLFGERINLLHAKDFLIEDGCIKEVQAGKGMLNYELLLKLVKSRKPYINIIMEYAEEAIIAEGMNYLKGIYDKV